MKGSESSLGEVLMRRALTILGVPIALGTLALVGLRFLTILDTKEMLLGFTIFFWSLAGIFACSGIFLASYGMGSRLFVIGIILSLFAVGFALAGGSV